MSNSDSWAYEDSGPGRPEGEDFDAGRLGEADFWFSPFSLPRYDWLVTEGHITQEEADRYRHEREEMGLPMRPQDIQAEPLPQFVWFYQRTGISIAHESQKVDLDGIEFRAFHFGSDSNLGRLIAHPDIPKPDDYLSWDIEASTKNPEGFHWSASCKLSESVYARQSGEVETLAEALAALRQQRFEPQHVHGLDWFPHENGWLALGSEWDTAITVKPHWDQENHPGVSQWSVAIPPNTPLRDLARLLRSFETTLTGTADTTDAGMLAAIEAPNQMRVLAAQIVGDEAFEAGRQAGRAEIKAQIAGL